MARFQIDETTWIRNYPNMIVVNNSYRAKVFTFTLVFIATIVLSIIIKQYLGTIVLIADLILIMRRFFTNKMKIAKNAYRSSVLASSVQEVQFKDDAVSILFEGSMFVLDWQGIQKVIYLPDLIYVKHKVMHFYLASAALSESEISLFSSKLSNLKILSENRRSIGRSNGADSRHS